MSDFGLLITGIFVTEQQSVPNLPEQLLVSHDAVEQVTSAQSGKSISTAQITPPEFIEVGENDAVSELSLGHEVKNIVGDLITKIRLRDSSSVVETNSSTIPINLEVQQEPTLSSPLFADGTIPAQYRQVQSSSLPMLEFGNSGVSVRILQKLLLSNGYGIGVDGFFGAVTEAAVKAFQNQRSLVADGIVGQKTWAELAN